MNADCKEDEGCRTLRESFKRMFNPRSIAIVGVSRKFKISIMGNTGLVYMHTLLSSNYRGHIYPVNPNADEILGHKAYPSVSSIPETPDLVVVIVPASSVYPVPVLGKPGSLKGRNWNIG